MTEITFAALRERLRRRPAQHITDSLAAEAAVALILVPAAEGDLEALFIRRAEVKGDPWSGHVALPGGRRDPGDWDLLETARREAGEETGVALPPETELGVLDDFTPRTPTLPRIVVRPYVFGLTERPNIKLSSEVAYHLWLPMKELRGSYTTTSVSIRGTATSVPAFVVGAHVIWGLTERIISPFIELYLEP